jgi:Tfp pilus assembly protein PilX
MKARQNGIATLVTLIALVIMLIAAVALVRSTGVSQLAAGNLAFRRDLTNRAEAAVAAVNTLFASGGLSASNTRWSSNAALNYSATILASTKKPGLPDALLATDTGFAAAGATGNDISADGVTVRYVVDRMCSASGAPALGSCAFGAIRQATGGGQGDPTLSGANLVVYRISVRVTGPHNTMEFMQATFASY